MDSTVTTYCKNEEYLSQRIGLARFEDYRNFPKFFEIETIRACNSRCTICTVSDWDNYGIRMSESIYGKIITEIGNYRDWVTTVCLSRDGEPLLDPDLLVRIEQLKRAGVRHVTLTTNAQLLSADLAEKLVKSGLDDIMISIDGMSKSVYEEIRVGLSYERVVANTLSLIHVRNMLGSNMSIRIRFVTTPLNQHEASEWLEYWRGRVSPIDRVYVMPMHSWGGQLASAVVESNSERPCVFLFSSLAIHADGSVGQCNVDYNATTNLGNIASQTIREIWTGPEIDHLRQQHLAGNRGRIPLCENCSLWERSYIEAKTDT